MDSKQAPGETPKRSEKGRGGRAALIALVITCILLAGLLTFLVVDFRSDRVELKDTAFDDATGQAVVAAGQLSGTFADGMSNLDNIADDLSTGNLAYDEIEAHFKQLFCISQANYQIKVSKNQKAPPLPPRPNSPSATIGTSLPALNAFSTYLFAPPKMPFISYCYP